TPGHIALLEAQHKFLISGDTLLPTIDTNAAFHVQHIAYPLQKYLDSLTVLQTLDFETVLPGHEDVFHNPRQRIEELFKNHEHKAGVIARLFTDSQPHNAYQVSQMLARSPRSNTSRWGNMTGWAKRFAVLQTIAHLESLKFNRLLSSAEVNGVQYFKSAGG
ncbi:MAG TPA: MBL fold metallo-hydrolase, partial [Dehalococcoidales bacterium]|nr:MBL fold metallo-hydrolase [Dehalococcoidales bacterium]